MTTESLPLVVMVDDVETDLWLNRLSFQNSGVETDIRCFDNAHDALDFLRDAISRHQLPALMILDLKMPEIDGFGVLDIMRSGGMKRFPVVVLSGSSLPEDTFQAKQLGADACFEKPITMQESNELFTKIARRYIGVSNQGSNWGTRGMAS